MVLDISGIHVGGWVKARIPRSKGRVPALISAVSGEYATVIAPSPHAGAAVPFVRVPGVRFSLLEAIDKEPTELEQLVKLLFDGLRKSAAASPAIDGARAALNAWDGAPDDVLLRRVLDGAEEVVAKLRRQIRSSCSTGRRKSATAEQMPVDEQSALVDPTLCRETDNTAKKLDEASASQVGATELIPSTPPRVTGKRTHLLTPQKSGKQRRLHLGEVHETGGQSPAKLVTAVSQYLAEHGMSAKVSDLSESLSTSFAAPDIAKGLQILDRANKVMLCDGVVYGL